MWLSASRSSIQLLPLLCLRQLRKQSYKGEFKGEEKEVKKKKNPNDRVAQKRQAEKRGPSGA